MCLSSVADQCLVSPPGICTSSMKITCGAIENGLMPSTSATPEPSTSATPAATVYPSGSLYYSTAFYDATTCEFLRNYTPCMHKLTVFVCFSATACSTPQYLTVPTLLSEYHLGFHKKEKTQSTDILSVRRSYRIDWKFQCFLRWMFQHTSTPRM